MTDQMTQKRLAVSVPKTGGPYIMLPVDQLAKVEGILKENNVYHWTDSDSISLDGKPAIIVINLGRGANAAHVQQLLDAAA